MIEVSGRLAVCAVFRDEGRFIKEWVLFHLNQGVEHIFLFNDRSQDCFESELRPFVARGIVTLDSAVEGDQDATYLKALKKIRGRFEWVAFIDLDEFLYALNGKVLDHLPTDPEVAGVFVYWKIFGTSGHFRRPEGSVVDNYLWSAPIPNTPRVKRPLLKEFKKVKAGGSMSGNTVQGKSIVRPERVWAMRAHRPTEYDGKLVFEDQIPVKSPDGQGRDLARSNLLRINHYWSKSIEDLYGKVARPFISLNFALKGSKAPFMTWFRWATYVNIEKDVTLLRLRDGQPLSKVYVVSVDAVDGRRIWSYLRQLGYRINTAPPDSTVGRFMKAGDNVKPPNFVNTPALEAVVIKAPPWPLSTTGFVRKLLAVHPGCGVLVLRGPISRGEQMGRSLRRYITMLFGRILSVVGSVGLVWRLLPRASTRSLANDPRVLDVRLDDPDVKSNLSSFLGAQDLPGKPIGSNKS